MPLVHKIWSSRILSRKQNCQFLDLKVTHSSLDLYISLPVLLFRSFAFLGQLFLKVETCNKTFTWIFGSTQHVDGFWVCVCFPLWWSLTESCSLLHGLKDLFLLQKLSLTVKLITWSGTRDINPHVCLWAWVHGWMGKILKMQIRYWTSYMYTQIQLQL